MDNFQAIIFGVIHGIAGILPLSSEANFLLIQSWLGWSQPSGVILGALLFGSFFALLVYFRDDWASMISSLLQVILYRRRPVTIDERLPLFIMVAQLPWIIAQYFLAQKILELPRSSFFMAGGLIFFSIPLWLANSFSRQNKGMSDWNWVDAVLLGLGQLTFFIPGCGLLVGPLTASLFRNYTRESAVKFSFFVITPILGTYAIFYLRNLNFHAPIPMPETSWLSISLVTLITFAVSLAVIHTYFMTNVTKKRESVIPGWLIAFRWLLAIVIIAISLQ